MCVCKKKTDAARGLTSRSDKTSVTLARLGSAEEAAEV